MARVPKRGFELALFAPPVPSMILGLVAFKLALSPVALEPAAVWFNRAIVALVVVLAVIPMSGSWFDMCWWLSIRRCPSGATFKSRSDRKADVYPPPDGGCPPECPLARRLGEAQAGEKGDRKK